MSTAPPGNDLRDLDALSFLLARAESHPQAPALSDGVARPLTAAALVSRVRAVAGGLSRFGFTGADQLRVVLPPGVTSVTLALAAVLAGGSVVINLDDRAGPALSPLDAAPQAWLAADSMSIASVARDSALDRAGRGSHAGPGRRHSPAPDRTIHVGAWLPGVPREALSLRRLASGPMFDAPAQPPDTAAVTVVSAAGSVTHTRADLAVAVPWLVEQIRLEPVDRVATDDLVLGVAALLAGAHWRVGPIPANRRELARTTVVGTTAAEVEATCELLVAAGSSARLVVGDGPLESEVARRVAADRRLVVLSGRGGLLPVAVSQDEELLAFDEPGRLIGRAVPGVRVLVDGERILTRGHASGGRSAAVDTGLRGTFSGDRLVALPS